MKIINVKQGTPEWLAARAGYYTASDAPAMMGCSPNKSRRELLAEKALGTEQEFSDFVQRRVLDKGHQVEAMAAPIVEQMIGEPLFPVCGVSEVFVDLWASFDGATVDHSKGWECKQWSEKKAAHIRETGTIPPEDKWQVVQLSAILCGPILYTVTDGTKDRFISVWYELDDDDVAALVNGWKQFAHDIDSFEPDEPVVEVIPAETTLPAIRVEVTGAEVSTNLRECIEQARLMAKESMSTELADDQDFVDNQNRIKAIKAAREHLKSADQRVLMNFQSYHEFTTLRAELDTVLQKWQSHSERADRTEKDRIRADLARSASDRLKRSVAELSESLPGGFSVPLPSADFAAAFKGKRTIQTLREAADQVVADAMIEARKLADTMRVNLESIHSKNDEHLSLFPDLGELAQKPSEDFEAVVHRRVFEHQQAAKRKAEQEAARQVQAPQDAPQDAPQRTEAPPHADVPPRATVSPLVAPVKPHAALPDLEDWRNRHRVTKKALRELAEILEAHFEVAGHERAAR